MWYVYLVRCQDNSIYTGITTNLKRRINRHNQRKGYNYTAHRCPVKLIYHEEYPDKSSASKRESYLKGLTRSKKEELVAGSLRSVKCRDSM
ncbi:MAG: GIY-YIG nuclease family protein [Planctomycetota bacterium]|nr:GIY-YIG nuclease family protein [Planctomycetota bacterium]